MQHPQNNNNSACSTLFWSGNRVCAADRSESEPLQDTTVPLLPPTWLPCAVGGCATPQGRDRDHALNHACTHRSPHFQCMRRWEHPRPPSSSCSSFSLSSLFSLHIIDKTNATHTEMTDAPQPAQPATETSAPAPSPAPASAAVTPPQHRSTVKPLALDAREPPKPKPTQTLFPLLLLIFTFLSLSLFSPHFAS